MARFQVQRGSSLVPVALVAALVLPAALFFVLQGGGGLVHRSSLLFTAQLLHTPEPNNYQGDKPGCERPHLDAKGLEEYGCRLVTKACIDQRDGILYDLPSNELPPYPFYDFGHMSAFIPGYENTTVNSGFPGNIQRPPLFRRNSSLERPDLMRPVFSTCHVPLVWAFPWVTAYGEFIPNNVVPLYVMQQELKLFDRNVQLAPLVAGYRLPRHVHELLAPFSAKPVVPFDELGSRRRALDPAAPRCFETMVLCRLKNLYLERPQPKFKVDNETFPYVGGTVTHDGDKEWRWWRGGAAGQYVVEFYQNRSSAARPPPADDSTLHILVGISRNGKAGFRNFLKVEEFLEACNAWAGLRSPQYRSIKCSPYAFGNGLERDIAALQGADIYIGHHGGDFNNGWFMRPGSSVVEVRMKDFAGVWPDFYFRSLYRTDNVIFYWQAQVIKDETWAKSAFEEAGQHENRVASRDRHTILRWPDFQPVVEAIVAVGKSQEAYEKLSYDQIRWDI